MSRFGSTVSAERQNQIDEELKRLAIEAHKRQAKEVKVAQRFRVVGNNIWDEEKQEFIAGPEKPAPDRAVSAEMQLVNAMFPPGHPGRADALQRLLKKHSEHPPPQPGIGAVIQTDAAQIPIDRTGRPVGNFAARPQPLADARNAKSNLTAEMEAAKIKSIEEDIASARALLPGATGSGTGTLIDKAAGFAFGHSLPGAKNAGRLKAIQSRLSLNTPRFEGPQGKRDVEIYEEMIGKIGDSNLPVETRMSALLEVERILLRNKKTENTSGVPDAENDPLGLFKK